MDNNDPHQLIEHIQNCIEESLDNSFKEWVSPNVMESIHRLCLTQDLEPNSDLNKLNSIGKLFGGFKGRQKLILENIMRLHGTYPTSQVSLYFHKKDVPNKQWLFDNPFDVPRLVFHEAVQDQSLVDHPFGKRWFFKLDFKHIGQDMDLQIYDNGFEVKNFNENCRLRFPLNGDFTNLTEPHPNSIIEYQGFLLGMGNGRIVNITTEQFVDVFLGNEPHEKPNIKKATFHLASNNQVEVFVLFTELYMAAGTIRMITRGNNQTIICELTEITSSYGTTDFLCGPTFKSMLRVSYFQRIKATPAIEMNELQKRLKSCRQEINDLLHEVETKLKKEGRKKKIEHSQNRTVLPNICKGLRAITTLYGKLDGIKNTFSPSGRHMGFLTVREQVHYAFYLLRQNCELVCDSDGECVMVQSFVNICKETMTNEAIPGENRLEFGYLLIFALLGLSEHLNWQPTRGIENLDKFIENCFNVPDFYCSDIRHGSCGLKLIGFPDVLRPVLLEMLLTSATVAEYKHVINLFKIDARGEEVELNVDLLKVLKKYPHVLLFGTEGVKVPKELFKQMGDFLDTFFSNAENVICLDDDED
ncbi:unnamed protein product [Caenorhabditis brenneri]